MKSCVFIILFGATGFAADLPGNTAAKDYSAAEKNTAPQTAGIGYTIYDEYNAVRDPLYRKSVNASLMQMREDEIAENSRKQEKPPVPVKKTHVVQLVLPGDKLRDAFYKTPKDEHESKLSGRNLTGPAVKAVPPPSKRKVLPPAKRQDRRQSPTWRRSPLKSAARNF
jgi:hypothetical protein